MVVGMTNVVAMTNGSRDDKFLRMTNIIRRHTSSDFSRSRCIFALHGHPMHRKRTICLQQNSAHCTGIADAVLTTRPAIQRLAAFDDMFDI